LDLSDFRALEEVRLGDLLAGLTELFPVRLLARQQRAKRETGLARSHRRRRLAPRKARSRARARPADSVTDTFEHCLFLTGESEHLTTLAVMSQLRARTPGGRDEAVQLSCGAGFSLYRVPDGWKIKLLEERTISLSRQALHERGWRLDFGAEKGKSGCLPS
jgi:hypothetical protein